MTSTLIESNVPRLNHPTVHRLANGLTIIAEQVPVEAVNLNIWLGVGSAIETNDINGMAHFLEHMIFKGSAQLQSGEFEQQIERRGAVTNAATSQDYTHYYITTAPQDFAELAPFQLEVLLNAAIPDEAFERERLVVLEEIRRSEDNPRRRTFYRAMEVAFDRLPYRRPVLGPTSVIETLRPQQMRDFHATWYRPQSMTAAVVGNLPVDKLIAIVANSLETVHPELARSIDTYTPERLDNNPEDSFPQVVRCELEDPSLQQARLVMMWRVPGLADLTQTYGLDVLAAILGQGRTARLVRDLREERGLVSSIAVSNMTYLQQGVFYISAQLPVENLATVEAAIQQHIDRLHREWVTTTELERIRTLIANRFVFGNETPSDRASLYGFYQATIGDLEPIFNYTEHIRQINAAHLQQVAQQFLPADAYGIVVTKPTGPS